MKERTIILSTGPDNWMNRTHREALKRIMSDQTKTTPAPARDADAERRPSLASSTARELGPWGCLCRTLRHHVAGDGCEICQPKPWLYDEPDDDEAERAP